MVRLEMSQVLGRILRKDDLPELGVSTRRLLIEAIQSHRTEEALKLLEYLNVERAQAPMIIFWIEQMLKFIGDNMGEETLYESLRISAEHWRDRYEKVPLLPPEERLQFWVEVPRGAGDVTIVEDEEKYTVNLEPCGSGGRLRLAESTGRVQLGRTLKAYPWSWGQVNVPYWCCHCCVMNEILPIEWNGFPVRVTEYSDNAHGSCRVLIYKDASLIPDYCFERVGKKKDPSKFKK